MANLKEVRIRITSVSSTQQITKAMKMVSAAKLKRATNAITQLRPYADRLRGILENLSASAENVSSPLLQSREANKVLLVVVSSNRGLAGAFNANVIKSTNALIEEQYAEQFRSGNLHILAIGKKAYEYYSRRGYNVLPDQHLLFNHLSFENAAVIIEDVMKSFEDGVYDKVEIVYNKFKNPLVQILTTEQLLPVVASASTTDSSESADYLLEPSQAEIIGQLLPRSIKTSFYKAILDSWASEHGARMTSMDKATENAGDLIKSLKLQYNQARQAAITTELTEIVSGANALSEG